MANYIVSTLDDALVANQTAPGTLADETLDGGGLSLREALILANGNGTTDTIDFTPGLSGTVLLTGGQLEISSDLTIDGDTDGDNIADITVDADNQTNTRVFILSGGSSTIDALTITRGSSSGGGGVLVQSGATGTITNSTIYGNSTSKNGGGIGISPSGTATITNSTISGNNASNNGGGVENSGTATLTNTTISGNSAGDYGGGVDNSSTGTVTLTNTTMSGQLRNHIRRWHLQPRHCDAHQHHHIGQLRIRRRRRFQLWHRDAHQHHNIGQLGSPFRRWHLQSGRRHDIRQLYSGGELRRNVVWQSA